MPCYIEKIAKKLDLEGGFVLQELIKNPEKKCVENLEK